MKSRRGDAGTRRHGDEDLDETDGACTDECGFSFDCAERVTDAGTR